MSHNDESSLWKTDIVERKSFGTVGDIEFSNVNFTYPTRSDKLALRNLNLVARAGKTTALVGQSGSGKLYPGMCLK